VLSAALRLGYGIAGYRHVLNKTGAGFIALWDNDGLEHILISKAILEGKGYIVDSNFDPRGKTVRFPGSPALFKAPLYQYFLAGIFSLSGFSFALFFPIQALLGSAASVLVAKIAMRAFEGSTKVGLLAGIAAAAHPVLVNTASQPYNENLFFFLFFLSLWMFLKWMDSFSWSYAVACGVCVGLTTLTRESMVAPFIAMVGFGIFKSWRERRRIAVVGAAVMTVAAGLIVAPWTLNSYYRYGIFVPVSSISGTSLGMGNNECVAVGNVFVPYDGEDGCATLDARRHALLKNMPAQPKAFWDDRAYAQLGRSFISQHTLDYLRLCFRRSWTTFLPYHPRQPIATSKKMILVIYFVLVVALGLLSIVFSKPFSDTAKLLLWVAGATFLPLAAIYVSADLRYRVGIDLILGCFAAHAYATSMSGRLFPAKRHD
jgi:hypothetical protein